MKANRLILTLALALILWLPSREAEAYPLNPWGGITSKGAVSLTPFLYVYGGPGFYPYLYVSYGASDKVDLFAGVGGAFGGGAGGFGSLELFPRFFVNENLGLVAHLYYYAGGIFVASPEVDFTKSWGDFSLTVNASWKPVVLGGSSVGTLGALIAPEYYLSKRLSLFFEVDPLIDLTGAGAHVLQLVPGVGFALEEDQVNLFAVGLQVALAPGAGFSPAGNLSLGVWYSRSFGGGGEE